MSSWITVRPVRNLRQTAPVWSNNAFNDPFFNETFNWFFGPTHSSPTNATSFSLNVGQDAENYYLWAVLPGVSADKLEINALEDKLTISAEVLAQTFMPQTQSVEDKSQTEQPKFKWLRRELPTTPTRYQRELTFPTAINTEGVQASYDNGILRVIVPQAPQARPHRVTVNMPARSELNEAH